MKLTKKLEADVLRAYHELWNANINGDIKTFSSYLDDNVVIYGTAEAETFHTKTEAIRFYQATADQMTGKADFRKRRISTNAIGDAIVINEECDLYVLAGEEWIFYGHIRVTAIFIKKGNAWKIVQMHGSFPDSRTDVGEQIAPEKIKAENIQLRDAVRRRTIELEEKNRELEIETALEKVRLVAMGMKSPEDMLRICTVISQQLAKLGLKDIRNVQTAIFYPERGTYMNYEYYAKHDQTFATEVAYKNHEIQLAFARKMMKGPNEEVREHLKGKKLLDWYNYQKTTNQFADAYLQTAESLNYYWFSLGPVALGISSYTPLTPEEITLFKRFMNVFELAYQRYLDIEKALQQAREAQIEAALERVRSRTMAMHSSAELSDTAAEMFAQLERLGVHPWSCGFNIINLEGKTISQWVSSGDGRILPPFESPADEDVFLQFTNAFRQGESLYIKEMGGEALEAHYRYLVSIPAVRKIAEEMTAAGINFPSFQVFNLAFFKHGYLMFITFEQVSEFHSVFHRFATVFEQTYTRFLDLQKAETQARESQIQLALERVRARTMAMQRSEELPEVAALLFQQVKKLGVPQFHCGFNIFEIDDKECTW
ncbi:MAG: nuclear transport factor 2 family protein, partial [Chitinophagaceae bacterium]|nr:nuclear transport factor 2 family protein [Chitinophagaceae bacterium]